MLTYFGSKLKRVVTCCFTESFASLLLGSDGGNVHELSVDNFKLTDKVIYRDLIVQKLEPRDFFAVCKILNYIKYIQANPGL